ncbi:AAA family ATPase [Halobaculum gomorrense]|uniref:Transitional endoplasmic reticulum ATPase n=1 Tax=Halobaculum gomorrense TaxID=43928 RepID=A0A1M5UCM7_9EURY|nr:AAA family ATPase [Halobaculum gomorrense]SHH60709.1 transitional endoplasmic reticulum ATPase [Halobaculum gomorrense]
MSDDEGLALTARGAAKRDAGRGIARLSDATMSRLGVLSGETVVIAGDRETAAKVWPAGTDAEDGEVLVDGETRANAGAKIGERVRVHTERVGEADAVTLTAPAALDGVAIDGDTLARAAKRDLDGRPVSAGEQVRIPHLGGNVFVVEATRPEGPVKIHDGTRVAVERRATDDPADASGDGRSGVSTTSSGTGASVDLPTRDRRAGGDGGGDGDSTADTAETTGAAASPPPAGGVTYEDIGGLDEELDLVRETIELPLSEPEVFARLGIDPPKGVLLHGPPGTGKTLIAKAVANEVDATFISVSGPEITSKYKGESEEKLREIFAEANESAPSIVFFDEIDSIAGQRDDGGDMENRIVGQLLSLMDGLDAREDVIVIGATNRVDSIDPALRRGGRFDREIEIGVPGEAGRREILEVHTRRMPLADDVDIGRLAARTYGFVGADIDSLTTEAALTALRRARRDDSEVDLATVEVTRADFESALAAVEPSAMREYVAEQSDTTFDDVGGLDEAKATLERAVTWPLTYAPLFEAAGADPPTGVLLYGPPGTGKTLLARAIAGESEVNFIEVAGPELLDRYVGESEKAVREVFERARQAAPSIVFFDEIDAIAADRDGMGDSSGVGERVVSQLLTELDRASSNPNLAVIAATNRREALDDALVRPGRLESHVEVPLPDVEGRRKILAVHTGRTPLSDDVDLDDVAEHAGGYSGAELTAVVREATMRAVERVADEYGEAANDHADALSVTMADFEAAMTVVAPPESAD